MERTDLREQFFAEVRNDPYASAVLHHVAGAWVDGYEQALRDHGMTDEWLRKPYSQRLQDAVEHLTHRRNKAAAEAIIAFAELGRLLGPLKGPT